MFVLFFVSFVWLQSMNAMTRCDFKKVKKWRKEAMRRKIARRAREIASRTTNRNDSMTNDEHKGSHLSDSQVDNNNTSNRGQLSLPYGYIDESASSNGVSNEYVQFLINDTEKEKSKFT